MSNDGERFGSAAWATQDEIAHAGLFGSQGPFLGYFNGRALRLHGDGPLVTFGGAGSGKLTTVLAHNVCGFRDVQGRWHAPRRMLVNDPRGELTAISIHGGARLGKAIYCINPYRLHGLPSHRVNPWDILRKDSPTLHADVKRFVADLIPSATGNEKFFTDTARNWSEALIKREVEINGGTNPPAFYDLFNAIEDEDAWEAVAEGMLNSVDGHVRGVAAQMDYKREHVPKEYSAVTATVRQYLSAFDDPEVRYTFSGSDFSIGDLCRQDCDVRILFPSEYQEQLAPATRTIVSTAMLCKFRQPSAPPVTFIIDEAATLGNFESLLTAYSYARGMGIQAWTFWQNPGQITRNFGPNALQQFIGSSRVRQFFGVRDIETAKIVSAMLGTETLRYDDKLAQDAARRNLDRAIASVMNGGDPFQAGRDAARFAHASRHRTEQARHLLMPDEVLNLREQEQVLFVAGLNLRPMLADKLPYFARPEMAGAYLPNPYHPPHDRVRLANGRWARVVTERVPARYAHLPQYQSGEWSYIEGYRPV